MTVMDMYMACWPMITEIQKIYQKFPLWVGIGQLMSPKSFSQYNVLHFPYDI